MNPLKSSDDLEGFARDFKQRRIKLGYTQVNGHFRTYHLRASTSGSQMYWPLS